MDMLCTCSNACKTVDGLDDGGVGSDGVVVLS